MTAIYGCKKEIITPNTSLLNTFQETISGRYEVTDSLFKETLMTGGGYEDVFQQKRTYIVSLRPGYDDNVNQIVIEKFSNSITATFDLNSPYLIYPSSNEFFGEKGEYFPNKKQIKFSRYSRKYNSSKVRGTIMTKIP